MAKPRPEPVPKPAPIPKLGQTPTPAPAPTPQRKPAKTKNREALKKSSAVEEVDVPKPKKQPPQPPQQPPQPPQGERRLRLAPENLIDGGKQEDADKDILEHLFSQAFMRWTEREASNKGVESIGEVVSHIQAGQSLKELEAKLTPLLSEQQSKAHILQAMMLNHQMERVALYWDVRWRLERDLWMDLREQKLTPRERLALLSLAIKEADRAAEYINGLNTEFKPMTEVEPVMDKAAKHSAAQVAAKKRKEFEGTTPQGREIIRRMTLKAKEAAAKLANEHIQKLEDGEPKDGKQ